MACLDLKGLTVLVTGASAGMGVEFARQLQAKGVGRLILVARRLERLEALAAELQVPCEVMSVDLTDAAQIDALHERFPDVDVIINNAGFGKAGAHLDNLGASLSMLDLNCRALLQLGDLYLPRMVQQGRGGILNVGSTAGMVPLPTMALYGATKAFVNSFSDALRSELRGTGVNVSCLAPGPVATEFFAVAADGAADPPAWAMASPQKVVRDALRGLERNTPIVTPSFHIRWGMGIARTAPSWLVRLFTGLYGKAVMSFSGDKQ
ncbi:MAG: SDR family oxidoreductase [Myxococcota bacterium]|nr:SDR family oxidoreductase [Myxococcota bacterium]